jgi:hypothetical protein
MHFCFHSGTKPQGDRWTTVDQLAFNFPIQGLLLHASLIHTETGGSFYSSRFLLLKKKKGLPQVLGSVEKTHKNFGPWTDQNWETRMTWMEGALQRQPITPQKII